MPIFVKHWTITGAARIEAVTAEDAELKFMQLSVLDLVEQDYELKADPAVEEVRDD